MCIAEKECGVDISIGTFFTTLDPTCMPETGAGVRSNLKFKQGQTVADKTILVLTDRCLEVTGAFRLVLISTRQTPYHHMEHTV